MLNAKEVLLSLGGFFGFVTVLGIGVVAYLAHLAARNEKNQVVPPAPSPTAFHSSTHELLPR